MPDDSFKDYILDQLKGMTDVRCRKMFGGYGLYCGDRFFGILHQGTLYFKTHSATRPVYESAGMQPFRPNSRQTLKNYFEVPSEVLEDSQKLMVWALTAIQAEA